MPATRLATPMTSAATPRPLRDLRRAGRDGLRGRRWLGYSHGWLPSAGRPAADKAIITPTPPGIQSSGSRSMWPETRRLFACRNEKDQARAGAVLAGPMLACAQRLAHDGEDARGGEMPRQRRCCRSVPCAGCAVRCVHGARATRAHRQAQAAGHPGTAITVGSFDFPESVLLAYIYADALAAKGFPVRVLPDLGTRELVDPALMNGLIQLVPEYSGSALDFLSLGRRPRTSNAAATYRSLTRSAERRGLVAAQPAPAQDANAIVVTAATAARYHLRSIADLARGGPEPGVRRAARMPGAGLTACSGWSGPTGCGSRPSPPTDAGGPLTLQALDSGQIGVGAAVHHRSGHPGAAPGHPGRQPRPAAGREHHPAGPPEHRGAVRPAAARRARCRFRPPHHRDAALSRRAGGAATGQDPRTRRRQLAARAGADPGKAGCAVSEKAERTTAAPGPPRGPGGLPTDTPAQRARRQRRPTGAPPPLPHPIAISTTAWLLFAVVILASAFLISEHTPWLRLGDQANTWFLRLLADVRTPWLTDVASAIKAARLRLGGHGDRAVGGGADHDLPALAAPAGLRGQLLLPGDSRPAGSTAACRGRARTAITIISSWGGYSAPSPPVATLTIVPHGCRVLPGRAGPPAHLRQDRGSRGHRALFCLARVYLAVDHPDDVLFGVALGVAIPVTAFRFFTPNEVFPVVYRRGRTAHVDVDGQAGRGDPDGGARPARAERARDQARRPGIVGRLDAAAAARRGGPRRVPVREAVHQGPRPCRSLVQALADHSLRLPGGRVSLPDGAAADRVRGPHAAAPAG